jgi:hypothetical protein
MSDDPHTEIALSDHDPRVRYELRPAPDSTDEYDIIMTSSGGTQAFRVPYEVGGEVLTAIREQIEEGKA